MRVCISLQGTTTLAFVVGTWALARGVALTPRARLAVNCLAGMAFVQVGGNVGSREWGQLGFMQCHSPLQVGLGIATLLYFVPTSLAASHQSGSVALLTTSLWLMHELRKKLPRL